MIGTTEPRMRPPAPTQAMTCTNVLGELLPDDKRPEGNRVRPGLTWQWYRHGKTPRGEPTSGSDVGLVGTFRHVSRNGMRIAKATGPSRDKEPRRRQQRCRASRPGTGARRGRLAAQLGQPTPYRVHPRRRIQPVIIDVREVWQTPPTSAKPERHGRPTGSRAHFLKLRSDRS